MTTGACSRRLFEVTGVTLVSSDFSNYRDAFFFSLTLFFGLEVMPLDLTERSAKASFALAGKYASEQAPEGAPAAEGTTEEEQEDTGFAWEDPEVGPPADLESLWTRAAEGKKKLNLKWFLEQLPRWTTMPVRPKQNNYRGNH